MKNYKKNLKHLFGLILIGLTVFTVVAKIVSNNFNAATTFSIIQTSKVAKLSKNAQVDLVIRYQNNPADIYSFDVEVSFDSKQFKLKEDSVNVLVNSQIFTELSEVEDSSTSKLRVRGYSTAGITEGSSDLLELSLTSIKGEATSSIALSVGRLAIFTAGSNGAEFAQTNIGLSSVNFSKTAIPWWVWLIIFGGLAIAIAGGYVFHLLLPDALGDAAKATANAGKAVGKKTKEIALLTANKTKELANRVFNRRPVAPKMKPSVSATSAKPAPQQVSKVITPTTPAQPKPQPRQKGDLTKPVQPIKPVETPTATPSVDQSNSSTVNTAFAVPLVSQKPMNQTIIKTRVVNPDGSVTTITKKVSKEAESSDDKK